MQKLHKLEVRVVWWVILPRYLTCRSFSLLRGANWQVHQALHANYVILFKFRKWDCLWSERSVVYKAETPYKPELGPKQDRWPSPHWVSCGLRWFCAKLSANPFLLSLYPKNKRIWKKKTKKKDNYIQTVRKAFPSIHFTHAIIWQGWFELFYGEHTNGFQF